MLLLICRLRKETEMNVFDILKQEPKVDVVETNVDKNVAYQARGKSDTYLLDMRERVREQVKTRRVGGVVKQTVVYKGRTLREWAEHYGCGKYSVDRYYRKYKTLDGIENYLKPGNGPSGKYDGKTHAQWAIELGISIDGVKYNISKFGHPAKKVVDSI
jgi:hypothetical protein